jgi:hypothetical protein
MIEDEEIAERGEAVMSVLRRGADFMKQVLDDNEALREQLRTVQHRQHEAAQSPEAWENLRVELAARIEELEDASHRKNRTSG